MGFVFVEGNALPSGWRFYRCLQHFYVALPLLGGRSQGTDAGSIVDGQGSRLTLLLCALVIQGGYLLLGLEIYLVDRGRLRSIRPTSPQGQVRMHQEKIGTAHKMV